jgi:hypothetical protein
LLYRSHWMAVVPTARVVKLLVGVHGHQIGLCHGRGRHRHCWHHGRAAGLLRRVERGPARGKCSAHSAAVLARLEVAAGSIVVHRRGEPRAVVVVERVASTVVVAAVRSTLKRCVDVCLRGGVPERGRRQRRMCLLRREASPALCMVVVIGTKHHSKLGPSIAGCACGNVARYDAARDTAAL